MLSFKIINPSVQEKHDEKRTTCWSLSWRTDERSRSELTECSRWKRSREKKYVSHVISFWRHVMDNSRSLKREFEKSAWLIFVKCERSNFILDDDSRILDHQMSYIDPDAQKGRQDDERFIISKKKKKKRNTHNVVWSRLYTENLQRSSTRLLLLEIEIMRIESENVSAFTEHSHPCHMSSKEKSNRG